MQYVQRRFNKALEVKQSKFIAYIVSYSEYKSFLETLKDEHPKARHFVSAYRYLNEYTQIVEYSSDDAEPRGTAGKPALSVLQGMDIINSAVIIVRYFGGTKLGTGGLVRAYSDAVNLVLSSCELFEYMEYKEIKISFEYANARKIEYECLTCRVEIVEKFFDIKTIYKLKAPKENIEIFLQKIDRLYTIL